MLMVMVMVMVSIAHLGEAGGPLQPRLLSTSTCRLIRAGKHLHQHCHPVVRMKNLDDEDDDDELVDLVVHQLDVLSLLFHLTELLNLDLPLSNKR